MFKAEEATVGYSPVVSYSNKDELRFTSDSLHGIDTDLIGVLPALQYCLHLPRNGFDTLNLPISTIIKGHLSPHNIILIPSFVTAEEATNAGLPTPTLVICDEESVEQARIFASLKGSSLGIVLCSDLTNELLISHWNQLSQFIQKSTLNKTAPLQVTPRLLSAFERKALIPINHLLNQLKMSKQIEATLQSHHFNDRHRLGISIHIRSIVSTLNDFEQQGKTEAELTETIFAEKQNFYYRRLKLPVIISLPGTAAQLQPRGARSNKPGVAKNDEGFIEILGLHRAAARGAYYIDGKPLPISMFDDLRQLEHHFKEESIKKISNHYLLQTMKRLGKHLSDHIGEIGVQALYRASEITAYTDYPIGLAILPGQEDPLCCTTPISYKPLTPLTRTLQMSIQNRKEHYIGKERGFKVVIAECVLPGDRIYQLSIGAWKKIREQLEGHKDIEVVYQEAHSINMLKKLLSEQSDADILVISAHGYYEEDIAGLCIGEDIWLAAENDFTVPPVVILSACHVAPRGVGAVTVNDLFLRAGARAVLGTLIPVDVRKNAILTGRLFTYLIEAVTNGGQFRTLSEAWHWVVASNAVNEILDSSIRLKKWAITRKNERHSPLEEFMNNKSVGRLRNGFIYSDTVNVLHELAKSDSIDVKAIVASQGYLPESCFYTWTGSPEEIILKEEVFEKSIKVGLLPRRNV